MEAVFIITLAILFLMSKANKQPDKHNGCILTVIKVILAIAVLWILFNL